MKNIPTKYTSILFVLVAVVLATTQISVPSSVAAILNPEPEMAALQPLAAPQGIYSHTIGNDLIDGSFTDAHNPSIFINESDTFTNMSESSVAINVDDFSFYAKKEGNPVTPLVVKVHGDNDFTVLAIGKTRTSAEYNVGVNTFAFADTTTSITVGKGEIIATGFMDANSDGSGWGLGGNPIPAGANGVVQFGANNQLSNGVGFHSDQDEVWILFPSPLIEATLGFVADRDTPSAVVGEKILTTNDGKEVSGSNHFRSYSFQLELSADDVFSGAVLYNDANLSGTSERFSDGISDLSKSTIGAQAASSLMVENGYIAYLCNGTMWLPEECTLYKPGTYNTLGDMDNDSVYIKVDQNDPSRHGQWGDVFELPQRAIASAQMPDGQVMFWQGGDAVGAGNDISIIDPVTMQIGSTGAPTNHDTFCPGPALMPNGSLMLAGGGRGPEGVNHSLPYIDQVITEDASSIFDWEQATWIRTEDMQEPHYYGTSVALPDGQVFHALGSTVAWNNIPDQSDNPEIWNGTSWEKLTGIDISGLHADNGFYNSNYYPYLHLMPNSNLFHSGGVPTMHEINPNDMLIHNQGTRAGNDVYRHWGNSIMIDEGILFVSGGRTEMTEALRTTVLIDVNNDLDIQSSYKADMHYDRAFHDMVQLPTGEIFVSGGNTTGRIFQDFQTVYATELYDRNSDSWSLMAPLTTPRNYHSTSLLMPDGRIWQAGGDCDHCPPPADYPATKVFDHHKNGQFYSPAYLFDENGDLADRPVIDSAPTGENGVVASQTFNVSMSGDGANDIADFNIIKLSSVTHQINTDVRRLSLDFTNNGGGSYTIEAHDNINVMTPGYWMLFAVNQAGVPSVAEIVHVSMTPGTENPTPNPKPTKVNLGNTSVATGGKDGFNSNLVINLSDTYTNDSGSAEDWYLTDFNFYAADTGSPVTPFIVTVNGDEDYVVKAIGTPREPNAVGAQSFEFNDGDTRKITVAAGEKIAIGFIDANPDGTPSGTAAKSIVTRKQGGAASDDIFYVGHGSNNLIVTFTEGLAPVFTDSTPYIGTQYGPRDYAFSIIMSDLEPVEATPTPEPTATSTATAVPTETPTNTPEPTATSTVPAGSTSTPTPTVEPTVDPSATPAPTSTPGPPVGELDEQIFLPILSKP